MASKKEVSEITSKTKNDNEYPNLYHDAERLLKTYRDVRWNLKLSTERHRADFELEYGMNITEYLDNIYSAGADFIGTKLEHQANTIKRTAEMLKLIDTAAHIIRENNSEGETFYWILYYSYFSPLKLSNIDEIVDRIQMHIHFLTKHTYFRYRKRAITTFASVLWGFTTKTEIDLLDLFVEVL